jgi:hypothetical protein
MNHSLTSGRVMAGLAVTLGLALTASACTSTPATPSTTPAATGALSAVCPATVVIQADWEPEAEHGGIYQLLGEDYKIDTEKKSVTGSLMDGTTDTGVDVQIRIGGSAVGYQSAQSLLYSDKDILLGYGRVSEFMAAQDKTPVKAVLASLNKSPYAIYWDSQTYPNVKTIADLKATDATVLVGSGDDVWISYLTGTGVLDSQQVDKSDAPKPATFVAAKGKDAEAGFITAEPYMYEKEVKAWGRPVTGQLIADTGYPEYFQALIARTSDTTEKSACLKALVPVMQRAQVAYAKDGAKTNALIVKLVETYDDGWVYAQGAADYAYAKQVELGLLANGEDGVMGSFDTTRVQTLIDIVGKYHDKSLAATKPDSLVTNEFLDTSVKLG